MRRSVPQVISLVAIIAGVALFLLTMVNIDRAETMAEIRKLGVLLPLVLLPSIGWHLLRAAGWYWPPMAWATSRSAALPANRCAWCC